MANKFITKEELNEKLDIYLAQLNSLNFATEENLRNRILLLSKKLNLFAMEDSNSDENRNTTDQIVDFMNQYVVLLNENIKNRIESIKQKKVTTIQEELVKRQGLLSVIEEKTHLLWNLLGSVSVSSKLKAILNPIVKLSIEELLSRHEDVVLVRNQLNIIDKKESLREKQAYCILKLTEIKASYSDLDQEILKDYNQVLMDGKAENIHFQSLEEQKKILVNRIAEYASNIELAKGTTDAEYDQKLYESKMKNARLELDQIGEQFFLYFLKKIKEKKINNYQDLIKRTNLIQELIDSRKKQVEKLCAAGFAINGEYHTVAERFNQSKILTLSNQLKKIENEYLRLEKRREELEQINILGKQELEEIFSRKEKSKMDIEENQFANHQKRDVPEIIFTDDYDEFEILTPDQVEKDKESRRKVLEVNEAKESLVTQLSENKWKNKLLKILDGLTSVTSFGAVLSESLISERKEELSKIGEEKTLKESKKNFIDIHKPVSELDVAGDLYEIYKDNLVLQSYDWFSNYQKDEFEDIEIKNENYHNDQEMKVEFYDHESGLEESRDFEQNEGSDFDMNVSGDFEGNYGNQPGKDYSLPQTLVIGSEIKLMPETRIYSNSVDVYGLEVGVDAESIGLSNIPLYVTRGVIFDSKYEIVYSAVDYGTDLIKIADEMGLDFYDIALGCSIGDIEGHFMGVASDQLNPNIEKGWIKPSDVIIVEMAEANIEKGGVSR